MGDVRTRQDRVSPELRNEDLARRAPTESTTEQQAAPYPQAVQRLRENTAHASPSDVLALQRLSGNQAVASLLAPTPQVPVQRVGPSPTVTPTPTPTPTEETDSADSIASHTGSGVDFVNQNLVATTTSGSNLPGFRDPTASTNASNAGGVASPVMSFATGVVGLGFNAKKHDDAREELKTAVVGTAKHRAANRDYNTSGADVGQNVSSVSGAIATGTGGVMGVANASASASAVAGSVGGAIATPLAVFQMGRYIRKAERARGRVNQLESLIADESKPEAALAASTERVKVLTENLTELSSDIRRMNKFLARARGKIAADIRTEIASLTKEHEKVAEEQTKAVQEQQKNAEIAANMKAALDDASIEVTTNLKGDKKPVSLRMIQAYALKKNNRGWVKKAVAATGAALGAAGGAASLVASIAIASGVAAGASVLMATPIGWALAGAAAVVGIGLASYQAWKFFSKRWKQTEFDATGTKRGFFDRLGSTLAFWKKTGPSKRETYAATLFTMANAGSDTVQRQEARKTLTSLGLDFVALNMAADKKNSEKLIAAKLAS